MTEHFAYTFKSDLTLEKIFKRLNQVGPWKWHERDNDRWANFMFSMPVSSEDYRSDVKILADYDLNLYVVNVWFKSDQPDAQAQFETGVDLILSSAGRSGTRLDAAAVG